MTPYDYGLWFKGISLSPEHKRLPTLFGVHEWRVIYYGQVVYKIHLYMINNRWEAQVWDTDNRVSGMPHWGIDRINVALKAVRYIKEQLSIK